MNINHPGPYYIKDTPIPVLVTRIFQKSIIKDITEETMCKITLLFKEVKGYGKYVPIINKYLSEPINIISNSMPPARPGRTDRNTYTSIIKADLLCKEPFGTNAAKILFGTNNNPEGGENGNT